jgi:HJR/Mrr/RecB family endonuclease
MYAGDVQTIAELLLKLQTPGVDMFEQRRHREEITRRGAPAVPELLNFILNDPPLVEGLLRETLKAIDDRSEKDRVQDQLGQRVAPNNNPTLRQACIRLLAEQYPEATHIGGRLLDFASNHAHETREMRLCALKAVDQMTASAALGRRLLVLLQDEDAEIAMKTIGLLGKYVGVLPSDEAAPELERLVGPVASLDIRCAAIKLLGHFGEIDVLERVCLLPLKDEREHKAVQEMVRRLLCKPRSVVRLSPKNFEHLVRRLLEKMEYESVEVTARESWDQGIDVTAWHWQKRVKGRERVKMVGQCKRYQRSNLVDHDVVNKMVESLKTAEAGHGVIITTSGFQPRALELARKHQQIELISGSELQQLLDRHFEKGLYRVAD